MNILFALLGGLLFNFVLYLIMLWDIGITSVAFWGILFAGINIAMAVLIDCIAKKAKLRGVNPKKYIYIFIAPSLLVSVITYICFSLEKELTSEYIEQMKCISTGVVQSFCIFVLVFIISIIFSYVQYNKYRYIFGGLVAALIVPGLILALSMICSYIISLPFANVLSVESATDSIVYYILMGVFCCIGIGLYSHIIYVNFRDNFEIGDKIKNGEISDKIENGTIYENKVKDYYKMFIVAPIALIFSGICCDFIMDRYMTLRESCMDSYYEYQEYNPDGFANIIDAIVKEYNTICFLSLLVGSLILYVICRIKRKNATIQNIQKVHS